MTYYGRRVRMLKSRHKYALLYKFHMAVILLLFGVHATGPIW